jgi:cytoskeleton protein RodZ
VQDTTLDAERSALLAIPDGTARVGAALRAAREANGWTLAQVAAALKIRRAYLEAIEDGRMADLPAPAYAIGFVRNYAELLGLDATEAARRFRADVAEPARAPVLDFPAPVPERGVPAGALALMGVVLAVAVYVGWYRTSEGPRPVAEVVPPIPERLERIAEPIRPPAPVPVPEPPGPPMPSVPPTSAAAAIPPPPVQIPGPLPLATVPPPAPPPASAPQEMLVRARQDSWIQVRDRAGNVVFNRVLRSGESWSVPLQNRGNLLLTTGNAGGTEILYEGNALPAIGAPGQVRRDLPLDPDRLRDAVPAVPAPARTN